MGGFPAMSTWLIYKGSWRSLGWRSFSFFLKCCGPEMHVLFNGPEAHVFLVLCEFVVVCLLFGCHGCLRRWWMAATCISQHLSKQPWCLIRFPNVNTNKRCGCSHGFTAWCAQISSIHSTRTMLVSFWLPIKATRRGVFSINGTPK